MRADQKLEREVAAICDLPREELVGLWVKTYGCMPPKGVKRGLLERSAGWHLQAPRLGGLSAHARRAIRQYAKARGTGCRPAKGSIGVRSGRPAESPDLVTPTAENAASRETRPAAIIKPPPAPGTRLMREWNGRMHVVDITEEAQIVRFLFRRYLELKSVRALCQEASAQDMAATLKEADGPVRLRSFCRGNLYYLLSNPVYVGKIRHRNRLYDGQHEAIVEPELFNTVQTLLASQAPRRRNATNGNDVHLLTGLVRDENGDLLRSAHANKKGVRYRYYVSKDKVEGRSNPSCGWRLPAADLESVVEHQVIQILADRAQLSGWMQAAGAGNIMAALDRSTRLLDYYRSASSIEKRTISRRFIRAVELQPGRLTIVLDVGTLVDDLKGTWASVEHAAERKPHPVRIECPFSLRRRGVEQRMILGDRSTRQVRPDDALVGLVLRANLYLHQLTAGDGRSLSDIASLNRTNLSEVSRLLPLAFLAPASSTRSSPARNRGI